MASFNFKWPHAANEVYVTGTFDNWAKTEKLEKTANGFEKHVKLPSSTDKIFYKFVVDGNWTTDHTAPSETDERGLVNNVLTTDHLLSSAAPTATSAALAGAVPLEKSKEPSSEVPGTFPETPFETPGNEPKSFSVNPLPATAGAGNPIKLAPGEKVPHSSEFTSGTIGSNVKLDQESYEKSGSAPPQLPEVLNKQEKNEAAGAAIFGLPVAGSLIPESSLPAGSGGKEVTNPTISSQGLQSTTSQLAGQQPLEPRGVPSTVTDSQKEAGTGPEASSSGEAVAEKSQVENELLQKVPEAPSTSESGAFGKSEKGYLGAAAGGLAAAGAAAAGYAYAAKDAALGPSTTQPTSTTTSSVPEVVKESQHEAHASPEASASPEAVREKSQVENELLNKVSSTPSTTESGVFGKSEKGYLGAAAGGAAAAGAAVTGAAYAAKDKVAGQDSGNVLPISTKDIDRATATTSTVPSVVTESQHQAHVGPEASSSAEAVKEKSAMEKELMHQVKTTDATGEPAPSSSAALASSAPTKTTETTPTPDYLGAATKKNESRDVSPLSRPDDAAPSTPKKDRLTPSSAVGTPQSTKTTDSTNSPAADSKKKRKSFFGKLKDKLKS